MTFLSSVLSLWDLCGTDPLHVVLGRSNGIHFFELHDDLLNPGLLHFRILMIDIVRSCVEIDKASHGRCTYASLDRFVRRLDRCHEFGRNIRQSCGSTVLDEKGTGLLHLASRRGVGNRKSQSGDMNGMDEEDCELQDAQSPVNFTYIYRHKQCLVSLAKCANT